MNLDTILNELSDADRRFITAHSNLLPTLQFFVKVSADQESALLRIRDFISGARPPSCSLDSGCESCQ